MPRTMIDPKAVTQLDGWFVLLTCNQAGVEYVASLNRYEDAAHKYGQKAFGGGNYRVEPVKLKMVFADRPPAEQARKTDEQVPF